MEYFELIKERYSVRKLAPTPVEPEKIQKILEAGQVAPTACNMQPQCYYVLQSAEAMQKLANCTKHIFGAPIAILVCYNKDKSWKRSYDSADSGETDASIAATQMVLAIAEMGLGTTWVGDFDPAAVRKEYGLPDNVVPHALLPIGYLAPEAKPAHLHAKRNPVADLVTYL